MYDTGILLPEMKSSPAMPTELKPLQLQDAGTYVEDSLYSDRKCYNTRNSMSVLDGLNPAQREAASVINGPVLILAGAGSGKTRTLTHRIAYLIEKGVPPYSILAVTFTNKAAGEMKERISHLIGPEAAASLWVGTFHSIGVRMLRRDGSLIGLQSGFTIYDADDSGTLVKRILRQLQVDEKLIRHQVVKGEISNAKNKLQSPERFAREYRGRLSGEIVRIIAEVFTRYQAALHMNNAVDFDDLLLLPVRLLKEHPQALDYYQNRFEHLLIDEYQDTNHAQYLLVQQLAKKYRNICAVGDDDQSIYGWRGADISNILDFEKDYPEAKTVRLEQNYRSTKTILRAAGSVVENNSERKGKTLWTENTDGNKLFAAHLTDEQDEAAWIRGRILQEKEAGHSYGDMTILYRTNAQSRAIEEAFVRSGKQIPYAVVGGVKFYERKEVKDAMAYLRVIVNPADSQSLLRIINVPRRGVGAKTLAEVAGRAAQQNIPLLQVLQETDADALPARSASKLKKFVETIESFVADKDAITAADMLERVLKETGLRAMYDQDDSIESERRLENLQELQTAAAAFCEANEDPSTESFLQEVSLVTDVDTWDETSDKVTLMTLHSAKGLEFPVVFISGMEERLFPLGDPSESQKHLEEERRLFYVGLTRAEQQIYLTLAERRRRYNEWLSTQPSRFLNEVPQELIEWLELPGQNDTTWDRTGSFSQESAASGNVLRKPRALGSRSPNRKPGRQESPRAQPAKRTQRPSSRPSADEFSQLPEREDTFSQDVQEFLDVGRFVMHPMFGRGKILKHEGRGDNLKVVIMFSSGQKKKILVRVAHLEPCV